MDDQKNTTVNKNNDEASVKATEQKTHQKRKRKEVAIFGNYRNYYGYRIGQGSEEDPRLKVLKKEWFEGKDCLDIGCNNGTITINIAQKFCCRSILGIDIDGARIDDAYWNLRKVVKMGAPKMPLKTCKMEEKKGVNDVEHSETELLSEETSKSSEDCASLQERDLFDVVSFQKENFVHSWPEAEDKCYDTIICLSVAKWIHLNWGDDGLITLFAKVWRLLHPGGIFILEPQPWKSYYNNHLVSETAKVNYQNIKIFPEDFQDILLDKIGFRTVENISFRSSGSISGFNRPVLAFWK